LLKPKKWLLDLLKIPVVGAIETLEDEVRPNAGEIIKQLDLPPSVKEELERFIKTQSPIHLPAWALMAGGVALGALLGAVMGWAQPVSRWTAQKGDSVIKSARLNPLEIIRADRRGILDKLELPGLKDDRIELGWTEDRFAVLQELDKFIPTPSDLVMWLAREVFEPDAIEKYGLDDEFEKIDLSLFERIGVTEEQALNYWRAHWQHASFGQIIEMRRRELLTDDDVWAWFRLVEIPPYWRPLLMELIWEVPTRVDVRRFWDMRTIDEPRLRELYGFMGYRGQNLEDYVLWTKVYADLPDLIARYKNGWLSEEDVKSELLALGLSETRMQEIWESKIKKPAGDERVGETKKLTRALIIKGAKKGLIDESETIDRLMELNYAEKEAEYIYLVEVTESASPETPLEFKALTDAYRRAIGVGIHETTEAAIVAERAYLDAFNRLRKARDEGAPQADILTLEALVSETKARFESALKESQE